MSVLDYRHLNESFPLVGFIGGMLFVAAALITVITLGIVTI